MWSEGNIRRSCWHAGILVAVMSGGSLLAQQEEPASEVGDPAGDPEVSAEVGAEVGAEAPDEATGAATSPERPEEDLDLGTLVVEAVRQKATYGRDGLYQPGATSFPLGGTLAELKEVPFSFSVMDRDVLDDIRPAELDNIAQFVPGVQMGNQVSNVTEVFVSRGFQLGRDNILVNGTQQADAFSVTPTELVSEIEFYRGPSTILNGQTPPGGAANIVTKKPLEETFARLSGTFDSEEQTRGALDVNLAGLEIFGRPAALRLNVAGGTTETFRDAIEQDDWMVAPVLTVNLTEATTATFELNVIDVSVPDDRGLPLLGGDSDDDVRFDESDFLLGTTDQENEQETVRLMFDLAHRWNEALTSNFQISYGETDRSFFSILAGSFDPSTGTLGRSHFGTKDEFESLDVRLDTTFEFETGPIRHSGIVGVQYRDFERRDVFTGFVSNADSINVNNPDTDLPFQGFGPGGGLQGDEESIEGFFQNAFHVTEGPFEGVRLVAGARVTAFENELDSDQDETEVTPRVGLGYTSPALPWLTVYGNYAESFDPQGGVTAAGETLSPQEGEQWEVGAKASFFEGRLSASLAWFDLENTDVAVADTSSPGDQIAIGRQENQGLEFELVGEVLPDLQVIAQYTFNDSEIGDDPQRGGNELSLTPEHSGSIWLRYDLPPFSSLFGGGREDRLTLAGGVIVVGDRFTSVDNDIELTRYARLDLMARYAVARDTTFQLSVQNVTDEDFFTGGNSFGGSVTPGAPRTFVFEVAHTF